MLPTVPIFNALSDTRIQCQYVHVLRHLELPEEAFFFFLELSTFKSSTIIHSLLNYTSLVLLVYIFHQETRNGSVRGAVYRPL